MGEADRRAAERMPVNAQSSCTFAGQVVSDLGAVKIRDVSLTGVGLVVGRKVEAGAMLAVGLANPDKGYARTMLVRVAHVTAIPGGFLVGGSFAEPLTYQELTALVM